MEKLAVKLEIKKKVMSKARQNFTQIKDKSQ